MILFHSVSPVEDVLQNVDECVLLAELLARPEATALVFIGDRYGEALLPLELRPAEFDALRETALEKGVIIFETHILAPKLLAFHLFALGRNGRSAEPILCFGPYDLFLLEFF